MITVKTELVPFSVPNYVLVKSRPGLRQDGIKEGVKYHVSELDDETLESLCAQFRSDVFKKAKNGLL